MATTQPQPKKIRYGAYRLTARMVRTDKHNPEQNAELTADRYEAGTFKPAHSVRFNGYHWPISEVIGAVFLHVRGDDQRSAYPWVIAFLDVLDAQAK